MPLLIIPSSIPPIIIVINIAFIALAISAVATG